MYMHVVHAGHSLHAVDSGVLCMHAAFVPWSSSHQACRTLSAQVHACSILCRYPLSISSLPAHLQLFYSISSHDHMRSYCPIHMQARNPFCLRTCLCTLSPVAPFFGFFHGPFTSSFGSWNRRLELPPLIPASPLPNPCCYAQIIMQLFTWTRNPTQASKIAARKEEIYDQLMNGNSPAEVPGVRAFLETLHNYKVSKGCRCQQGACDFMACHVSRATLSG